MRKTTQAALGLGILMSLMLVTGVFAEMNPCNPCGGEHAHNPCNPCDMASHTKFYVDDDRNVLTFESKAPLETIIGTTNKIVAQIHVDPDDITNHPKAHFELDLASMKTGIGLRDEHMRDRYLETDEYPKAILTIDKITETTSKKLVDQQPLKVDVEATLKLHGVKRQIQLEDVEVTYFAESEATRARMPGDLLHIRGGFSVDLPDYNIEVPQMVVLKLDETIKVNIDVFGTTTAPQMAQNPCNPCGGEASNPCNPCGEKASNPCGDKTSNPCNPCG